jgi:GTP cyclohydrolase I
MKKRKVTEGILPSTNEEKAEIIKDASEAYGHFLSALGFDYQNLPHMKDTPLRVAKAFVNDLYDGVYSLKPNITAFPNIDKYNGMVFSGNIDVKSSCSHHVLPFVGEAHVAYIPSPKGKIIGLSKLNRIVEYFSRRPQVQENLTVQIHDYINEVCEENLGVAVVISAKHMCACLRGVKHNSIMKTSKLSGAFKKDGDTRQEFYNFIKDLK